MARRGALGISPPAPALVLGAVASVQCGAAIATRLFSTVGPLGTVTLRLVTSAVVVAAISRPPSLARRRGDVGVAVAYGVAMLAMNGVFYEAIDRIPLGVAVTIEFVGPLVVALAGVRRRLDLVWAVLAAAGVVLLTAGDRHVDLLGAALALVAGGFWAAYIVLSQRVGRAFPGAQGLAVALAVAGVGALPFGLVQAGTRLVRPSVLGRGLAVGVLSSALPYSLELFALRRLSTGTFGVLMSLEPAVAALSGYLLLGQHLHGREWLAIALVVVASAGATRRSTSAVAEPVEPVLENA